MRMNQLTTSAAVLVAVTGGLLAQEAPTAKPESPVAVPGAKAKSAGSAEMAHH
jgi:hypothetical protein